MGGEEKRRKIPGTTATIRNLLVLVGCFLFGVVTVRILFQRPVVPTTLIHLGDHWSVACSSPQEQPSPCDCAGGNKSSAEAPERNSQSVLKFIENAEEAVQAAVAEGAPGRALEETILFVGILSGRGYRHRRLAVRESWANHCQVPGQSVCRFILSEDEETPQVHREVEQFGDVVFIKEKTNYKSILFKTYFVFEYAITHYDARYILKTDDDAFINVAPLVHQLGQLCQSEDCRSERLYMGRMAKESEVLLQPGHKWNNMVFHNHTGLKTYPNYAMGGGYVLSGDVAKILVTINKNMRLKFTPIEDATIGFWLMAMDLRHIDHDRFWTWAAPCCFKAPVRREGQRIVTRFQLEDAVEEDLCSDDPWLVLHKIDSPTKMRFIGKRVAECNATDLDLHRVAPSIAPYVSHSESAVLR